MNPRWLELLPSFLRRRLAGRHRLQSAITNAGWLMVDRLLRVIAALSVGVWIARYLGPAEFGAFSWATALVVMLGPIASLGLDAMGVKYLVEEPEASEEILGTLFGLRLMASMAALLFALSLAIVLRGADRHALWLVGIIALGNVFLSLDVIDQWFQSRVQSKYVVYAKNSALAAASLLRVAFILGGAPVEAFAACVAVEVALGGIGLLVAYRANAGNLRAWRFSPARARRVLRAASPLLLSGLAVMVYMKVDLLMIRQMLGERDVGLYSAATRISEILFFIPMALASTVAPSLFEAKTQGAELYRQRMKNFFRLMAVGSVALAAVVTLLSDFAIDLLYGAGFKESAHVLRLHVWALVFVSLGNAQGPWMLAEGHTRLILARSLIALALNVGLNLFLISSLGIVGAAIATVFTQAVVSFLINIFSAKTRDVFWLQVGAFLPPNLKVFK